MNRGILYTDSGVLLVVAHITGVGCVKQKDFKFLFEAYLTDGRKYSVTHLTREMAKKARENLKKELVEFYTNKIEIMEESI